MSSPEEKWIVSEADFGIEGVTERGNRYLCANGYMGIRGTLEEHGMEELAAVNLAGIYDLANGGWREPLNVPNPLRTVLYVNGDRYSLPNAEPTEHRQVLDYRHGIMKRRTVFETKDGAAELKSERFAHSVYPHVLCMRYEVSSNRPIKVEVRTGIDCELWELNGPHFKRFNMNEVPDGTIEVCAETTEKGIEVAVAENSRTAFPVHGGIDKTEQGIFRNFDTEVDGGKGLVIEKLACVYTGDDVGDPAEEAVTALRNLTLEGYDVLREKHIREWERRWEVSEVTIVGDDRAQRAINYSLYHLMSIAPRHAGSLSIPARGLSGQTYKGAVFWDTEMFMLDFFANTDPKTAKSLIMYRINTLDGARAKARQYGYEGAFYAWESQEGGFDACSDYNVTDVFTGRPMRTYFRDKQIHISGAVVYGLMKYIDATGDTEILYEGGAEMVLECARFYDSCLVKRVRSDKYELWDVIGPDEYHERVNNNGYTNRMAKYVFDTAVKILERMACDKRMYAAVSGKFDFALRELFQEDSRRVKLPYRNENGVLQQFDGYFSLEDVSVEAVKSRLLNLREYWGGANGVAAHTQVIKQADIVTQLVMFPDDLNSSEKWENWKYYEPRTEHGSSLSACMYSILACECEHSDMAYPLFLKSAEADLAGGGKEWAGDIYIGGTHPAAAGGAYMALVNGFAGVTRQDGALTAHPRLPEGWKRLRFHVYNRGKLFRITVSRDENEIICLNP